MGFDHGRVVYEDQSRNTYENAIMTYDLVRPDPDETWALITSAMHMPRSVGVFRKAGWMVLPYPVDFKTEVTGQFNYFQGLAGGFDTLGTALKEWIGLIGYRMLGRTDNIFPAP